MALNVLARRPTERGWLTIYPAGADDSGVSSVNFDTGGESTNGFDLAVPRQDGRITVTNHSAGTIHLQVSVRGYYLRPEPTELKAPTAREMESLPDDDPVSAEGSDDGQEPISDADKGVGEGDPVSGAPEGVELTEEGTDTPGTPATGATPALASPLSGCGVWAWNYRDSPYAKGTGLVSCKYRVAKLLAATVLYRQRWYGWQFLDDDPSDAKNAYSVTSVSRKKCKGTGTFTYKSDASGKAVTYTGRKFSGTTPWSKSRYKC
ncbi:hypothetical protein ACFQHO_53660 [Actinomadura yumaensis]|uniref:hypothetical protein n=1 Tax=Actinomadura yumaensis TaxID=111807 RepID=UPI0036118C0F